MTQQKKRVLLPVLIYPDPDRKDYFGPELFWLKIIHHYYPVGDKVEMSPEQPIWRYVDQKLPLRVNLIHWNGEPLKYYMPASLENKDQARHLTEGDTRSKNSTAPSKNLRRSAVREPPSFFFPKVYTMEEDMIICQQRAGVLRAHKNLKGRRHRERSLEVPDMVDELPHRNSELSDNARSLQEAKRMPLDAIIEQLEKELKDQQAELAAQSSRLLEKLQAEGAMHQGKIAITGLEYLTGSVVSARPGSKKKPSAVAFSSELAESGLRSASGLHGPKSSIRTFFPTAEEEEFVLQVEAQKVLSGRQPNCSSQNRGRNLFLAPTVNQTGNNAFQKPAESAGYRNPSDAFICQICNTLEDDEENPIVFCSKCSITVHKACYRMDAVPSEHQDWICRLCETFGQKGRLLSCALCTRRGGALFPTTMKSYDPFLKKVRSLGYSSKRSGNSANQNPDDAEIDVANRPLIGSENVLRAIETDRTKDPKFYEKLDYNYNLEPHEYTTAELGDEPVSEKAWVHWTCGFWVPGLDFDFEQELIHQIDQVDPHRFKLQCLLCAQSRL